MFRRFFNLIGGKCRRWMRMREARDPESVYEAAISGRIRRYQQLKSAAAGVIYLRSKLEGELKQKTAEMQEVEEQIGQAADLDEDRCALLLIQRKQTLASDCQRLGDELNQLTREAEEAKKNLMGFKGEIDQLKAEKVRMLARLKNAQARVRIQHALEQLSSEDDVSALEDVRESIQRTLAEAGVNRELAGSELDEKLEQIRRRNAETKAQAELAEIKRRRRMPALPLPMSDGMINGAGRQ
ncbi:MAG: PspA/IM30 family protein [Deltaproteobacteria bacterium]|nr:PspA/IM30 family protein [Deltaproteobacteria bacterium]